MKAAAADVKANMSSLGADMNTSGENSSGKDVKPTPKLLSQMAKQLQATTGTSAVSKLSMPSQGATNRGRSFGGGNQELYARKLKKIKREIKDTIFVNGAVCDEVLRTEEKLARAKEERRFLLRKLLQYQSVNEPNSVSVKTESSSTNARPHKTTANSTMASHDTATPDQTGKVSKAVKRKLTAAATASSIATPGLGPSIVTSLPTSAAGGPSEVKRKALQTPKDILDSLQIRPKKGKSAGKRVIPPLMLDSLGRPVFPMCLGDITLHSIGEIVIDRLAFHCQESIYPVGYCSTRVYASLHQPDRKCLYTCKISDHNDGPLFEIASEDSPDIVFKGSSPSECHCLLIRAVNKSRGGDFLSVDSQGGLDFFGLSHPVIQNLVQSCPGARKCSRYKWVKFEINKSETNENVAVGTSDPIVGYEAFKSHMAAMGAKRVSIPAHMEQSTNLRSLLTKGTSQASL